MRGSRLSDRRMLDNTGDRGWCRCDVGNLCVKPRFDFEKNPDLGLREDLDFGWPQKAHQDRFTHALRLLSEPFIGAEEEAWERRRGEWMRETKRGRRR
ncbi:hypothetical protein SLEP1_g21786 [Rubroshorea leprosula]|uniref:Uncharacterized protein n=1 Tax=Rubroshorea leprosula TaxID=152421 RepID=A0AAV5JHP5_9ROSI|nr:hypothetical protein SLEP1_g21786 [Rubroshorea leprosula]